METAIKILHLETNTDDIQIVQKILTKTNLKFEYFFADNESDYVSQLRKQKIDIILSDYDLPDYSGTQALLFARSNYPHIPFVFVSGAIGEDKAIESMLDGATDYVLKNKIGRLVLAIQRSFKNLQEYNARLTSDNELQKKSRTLEQIPNSVVITDTSGTIEYINQAALKLSGFSRDELVGKNQRMLNSGENREVDSRLAWEKVNSGKAWCGEFHNKKKYGEGYWEAVSVSPVMDNNGSVTNYVTIKEDITDRRQITQDLIAAKERAEEIDLHHISHELRTPLNAIVGFSEFLNNPDLGPSNRKHYTELISQNSDHLLSIITNIESIAAIASGQEKINETELNLNATLQHMCEKFGDCARKQNLSLRFKPFLPYEARIVTDETKLIQVLSNLINNALRFTKQGHINFGYVIKAGELEFFVEDTGTGIPPEMHKEIFSRFHKEEIENKDQSCGAGLGLAISKAYIELLGGKIWFVSGMNTGSTFYFTIPYIKAKKNILSERRFNKGSWVEIKEPKTVLVAEDEDSNFQYMEALLLNLDIKIVRATSGAEAIATCKSKHIDVVLMDIQMPEMDGYEATKQIREFMPTLPIIAQTAHATSLDIYKARASGCTDFISKPFTSELFISKVKEQLYNKQYVNTWMNS